MQEQKLMTQKINNTNSKANTWLFENTNKNGYLLESLLKTKKEKKRQKGQEANIRKVKGSYITYMLQTLQRKK